MRAWGYQRESSASLQPCLWLALLGHSATCVHDTMAFKYLNRPSFAIINALILQGSIACHRPCSTNQVSGAQSLPAPSPPHTPHKDLQDNSCDNWVMSSASLQQQGQPAWRPRYWLFHYSLKLKAHESWRMWGLNALRKIFNKTAIVIWFSLCAQIWGKPEGF